MPASNTTPGRDGSPDATTEFWSGFAARHYRREPAEFGSEAADFGIGQDELFALLLAACAARDSGPAGPQVRFHLGSLQVLADLDDYLPAAADGTLDGYLRRLDRQLSGGPYLLTVQQAHTVSRPAWKRAATFLAGLQDAAGLLPGNADVEAFVGRYPSTAAGIHRERSGVFVSAVRGTKDMLVWPPGQSGLPLRSLRYEPVRATARRLRCEPGRVAYWPALHWHVGESPAAPTAALHLAVIEEPIRLQDIVARTLADVTGSRSGFEAAVTRVARGQAGPAGSGAPALHPEPPAPSGPAWPEAASAAGPDELGFPARYEAAAAELTGQLGDGAVVRDHLTADWLRRRTGLGFTARPPRDRGAAIARTDVVIRDSVRPIVLARRDGATSWCAADGRVADVRSAAALGKLVAWINSGQPVPVRAALELAATDADRELLRRVLSLLAAWRAVRLTS